MSQDLGDAVKDVYIIFRSRYGKLFCSSVDKKLVQGMRAIVEFNGSLVTLSTLYEGRMCKLPPLGDNEDFVLRALARNGMALQHVSKRLQRTRRTVLAAVAQNGLALQFAHPDLRADPEVVLPAVAQNGNALCWASRLLRNDPNIAFQALALNGTAINHLGEALRSDANQVLLQVTRNEGVEEYTAPYIVPPWGPLDSERHREVVLRWLGRRWNVPNWKSCALPARDFPQSLSPSVSQSDAKTPQGEFGARAE
ncbi:unnamed protein product [Symbiodinium natans]|uniref:DUF4116 domain-containing protein n=1 Tax=Symbiodinium natans TaxID=878477 RepID=A0A812LDY1_9DINO|nr:unnamed protein product [Symbiodinium natans]